MVLQCPPADAEARGNLFQGEELRRHTSDPKWRPVEGAPRKAAAGGAQRCYDALGERVAACGAGTRSEGPDERGINAVRGDRVLRLHQVGEIAVSAPTGVVEDVEFIASLKCDQQRSERAGGGGAKLLLPDGCRFCRKHALWLEQTCGCDFLARAPSALSHRS